MRSFQEGLGAPGMGAWGEQRQEWCTGMECPKEDGDWHKEGISGSKAGPKVKDESS